MAALGALANGVSEEDGALFGRISAKSGMKIVVTPSVTRSAEGRTESAEGRTQSAEGRTESAESKPAWYDGKNTVYVDADADRVSVFSGLLGHEMWHKMFKSGKARRIMMQAYRRLDKATRAEVEKAYTADSERRGFDKKKTKEVNREEVAAAYAEELFNDPEVWDFILSEEASLADRTLKFFEKAEKRYSFAEEMPKAARKWLAKYKMLFDQVTTYNKGRNVAENAVASDTVKRIERIGRVVENSEFEIRNSELDDGSRAAIAGRKAETADKLKLDTAEQMLKDGADSETVRRETGWFKGYDGKWRFEIDDSRMEYSKNGFNPDFLRYKDLELKYILGTITANELEELQSIPSDIKNIKLHRLDQFVKHKELFAAYPELKRLNIIFDASMDDNGVFYPLTFSIKINPKAKDVKKTLLHEIQHAIQHTEGLTGGGDVKPISQEIKNRVYILKEEQKKVSKELETIYKEIGFEKYSESLWEKAWNQEIDPDTIENLEEQYLAEKSRKGLALYNYQKQVLDMVKDALREESEAKENAFKQYQNLAGEIEARDVANRINFTTEQRKNTRPDIDNPNVVFADGSTVSYFAKSEYDAETANLKNQLKNSQDILNRMDVVYTGTVPKSFDSKSSAKTWAFEDLKRYGLKVDKQGFGVIEFSRNDIYGAIEHLKHGEEIAAIVAVPRVLKRGIQIGEHGDHKLRDKHTVTFGAPVELNGTRGNMAVVVNMKNKKYYVHRIVLPDGSSFKFNEKNDANQEMYQGVPKRSLANTTRFASDSSILDSAKKSNSFDKKTSKDFKNDAESDKNVDDGSRSALKKVGANNSEVAAVKKKLTAKGVDPRGVAAVADYFFDTYGGALTRNAMRYRFMEAADVMTVWDSESFDRAYAKIEKIADEIVNNPKDMSGQTEEIKALKSHLRSIRFVVHDADKSDFDVYGGYGEFRKNHMGKLTLANDGAEIDPIYAELQNQYGLSWFPEVNTVSDQLMRMAQISDMDEDAILGSVENVEAEAQAVAQSIVEKTVAALQAEQAVKEKRMSKSQNEAFKKRARAKAEVHAAKAIARAQKRLDAEAAKLRTRAETADARAEAKYERATETAKAKLRAEYETDATFSEASVKVCFLTKSTNKTKSHASA